MYVNCEDLNLLFNLNLLIILYLLLFFDFCISPVVDADKVIILSMPINIRVLFLECTEDHDCGVVGKDQQCVQWKEREVSSH